MSKQIVNLNTGQQAIIHTDISKIFVWNNRYDTFAYNNDDYNDVTLQAGTVMGRISATGKIKPLRSDNADGSQFPIGVLNQGRIVAAGETVNVSICVAGDVVKDKLVFAKAGDTLDTVVSGKRLRDRIGSDTVGIKLVGGTEHTKTDND
ncbi:hypothetical protein LCGC14_0593590 [marine sediment metagenome]|uniref:Head decoration protein n=1 Tax=marine sediment metagenome TaxID=412755 RepID=A0A0F9RHN2_9ZZZZ